MRRIIHEAAIPFTQGVRISFRTWSTLPLSLNIFLIIMRRKYIEYVQRGTEAENDGEQRPAILDFPDAEDEAIREPVVTLDQGIDTLGIMPGSPGALRTGRL
ncbi:MAG: hypothetical protein M1119_09450 [Firmicutes bacterium]|nr:hypothetical protein [Bacillota bacterium]